MSGLFTALGSVLPTAGGGGGSGVGVASVGLGTLRNDYGNYVGIYFTVGAAPITVTEIGRWVVSGNLLTHDITIRNLSNTDLGTVNVATLGATAAAYLYGTLGSPVVLSASTKYYILSKEENSGDQWYDSADTTMTLAAQIASGGGGYIAAGSLTDSSANHVFGPVNFKYTY